MTEETALTPADAMADLAKRRDGVKAGLPKLEQAVVVAAQGLTGLAKDTPVADVVSASGKLSTAQRALENAQSDIAKYERGIAALEREAAQVVDRPLATNLQAKADAKCVEAGAIKLLRLGLNVSGSVAVDQLAPTKDELALCDRHDIHVVSVVTVRKEDKPPELDYFYFPRKSERGARKGGAGGGGGGRASSWEYNGQTYTSEALCRQYADAGSVAKVDAAKAQGKSVSFAHLAQATAVKIGAVKTA